MSDGEGRKVSQGALDILVGGSLSFEAAQLLLQPVHVEQLLPGALWRGLPEVGFVSQSPHEQVVPPASLRPRAAVVVGLPGGPPTPGVQQAVARTHVEAGAHAGALRAGKES